MKIDFKVSEIDEGMETSVPLRRMNDEFTFDELSRRRSIRLGLDVLAFFLSEDDVVDEEERDSRNAIARFMESAGAGDEDAEFCPELDARGASFGVTTDVCDVPLLVGVD